MFPALCYEDRNYAPYAPCGERSRSAPSQTGQARFRASGFPAKAALADTPPLCGPIPRGATYGRGLLPPLDRIPRAPWPAALRPVDGFPVLRLLRRLCPHREWSRPVPVSLTAPPAGFPGSTAVTFSGSRRSLSTTWGLASASPGHRNSPPVREEEARTDCEDNPPGPRREPLTSRSLLGDYASQRSYAYPRLEA
jgi:hypothetical protein